MSIQQHRAEGPQVLGFAVITVSDTRQSEDDVSGHKVAELVTAAGHHVRETLIVQDELANIREAVRGLLVRGGVDVVVLTGGTGYSPRDLTAEAVTPLFEVRVEGFGELFRMLSFQEIGASAMLSRAVAGLSGGRAVFLLPGSPAAVTLAMQRLILPEAGHLLGQARKSR